MLNKFCYPKITDISHLLKWCLHCCRQQVQLIITSPAELEVPLWFELNNNFTFLQITVLCTLWRNRGIQMWQASFEPDFPTLTNSAVFGTYFCPLQQLQSLYAVLRKTNFFHQFRQTKNQTKFLYNLLTYVEQNNNRVCT